jgi:uncharacterized phage protein (predicted DNA packaging)
MTPADLLDSVKENLILQHDQDDGLLLRLIAAAVNYAEGYQHVPVGFYADNPMPPMTEQAIIMLSSHLYESRDGSTGGFFADSASSGELARETIDKLLRLERRWGV